MSRGTKANFEKNSRYRDEQEDFEKAGRKKRREKRSSSDESEQFLESMEPEAEKIRYYNERFESIEQSVEGYKASFAEYLGQLESDDNSLGLKKDFCAKAMRLIDGLNNTELALMDLKNKQLSEVEGAVHELVLSSGGIPDKAIGEYEKLNQDLDTLRDKIQEKAEEVERLKKEDHDTIVKKGHEQGATDADGIVGQAQAEHAKERAQRFFTETVSRFTEAINQIRAVNPEEFTGDNVAFEPPTSWGQIVSDKQNDKELLFNLEALSAREIFDQMYVELQDLVEQKNEQLKSSRSVSAVEGVDDTSVFDAAEEAGLEAQIDQVGDAVIENMELAEQLSQKKAELKDLWAQAKKLEGLSRSQRKRSHKDELKKLHTRILEVNQEINEIRSKIKEEETVATPAAKVEPADNLAENPTASHGPAAPEPAGPEAPGAETLSPEALEAQLQEQLNEEIERIQQLPPKERTGVIEGLANAGYWLQKTKSNAFKNLTGGLTFGMSKKSGWGKYITEYAKTYERDAARAEKMQLQKKGTLASAAGLGALTGNLAKLGRVAYDFAGGSLRSLNPFRHVTTGALFVSRGAEAAKEVRLGNEKVISKNRTLAHIDFDAKMTKQERQQADRAVDAISKEAWALYEKAGVKDIKIIGADGSVDQAKLAAAKQLMDKAYMENLPEDLKKRLSRLNVSGVSLLEKFFLKGDVFSSVDILNGKLEKIENNPRYSAEEKAIRKQAVLASSERMLKDLDRMIGDQGMVDWLAYAAKKTEWTGKVAANVMLLDTIRIAWQQLPELAHAINEWKIGVSHAFGATPKARVALPPEAEPVNAKTIDTLDNKAAGVSHPAAAKFGQPSSAARSQPEGEPTQPDGRAGSLQGQHTSSRRIPVQEQVTSTRHHPVPGHGSTEMPPKSAAETESGFDPNKNFSEEAVVHKGDGVIRVLKRQIVESPQEFGYKGDPDDDAAIEKYASSTAAKVAAENGYWNRQTGEEIRLGTKSIGRAAYVLERKGDGRFEVHEYFNGNPSRAAFQLEETHATGSSFEGKNHESYEYLHNTGESHGGAGNLDKEPVGPSRAEPLAPELRELLEQNEREALDLAKNPHGIESEASKLAHERYESLAAAVGKDANGDLLIRETEISKVINFYDGISPDEKAKLDFWKGHLDSLKSGSQAKEFFTLADRAFADKAKVEYSGHMLQAYSQMPEDVKSLPGRAVGYFKVFGGAGYGDTAREGVKEMIGLGHEKELNFKLNLRSDGVVVAEGIKLPGMSRAVDVYISHDKIGMMQPNSFLGFGRWDFWKGDFGVKNGQPMFELNAKHLRDLTHNIRNINNLNELNERRFAHDNPEGYPGQEKEVKMIPNEPEEETVAKSGRPASGLVAKPEAAVNVKPAAVQPEAAKPYNEPRVKGLPVSDIQRPKLGAERLQHLDFQMRSGNIGNIAKLSNNEIGQYLEARGVRVSGVEQKNLAVLLEKIRNAEKLSGLEARNANRLSSILTVKMRELASQNETVRTGAATKIQQLLGGSYHETTYLRVSGARENH